MFTFTGEGSGSEEEDDDDEEIGEDGVARPKKHKKKGIIYAALKWCFLALQSLSRITGFSLGG